MGRRTVALKSFLVPILAGICLSRIIQPLFFPLDIGTFSIDFGHVSILATTIFATLLYGGLESRFFWMSLSSSFDQAVYLAVKANQPADFFSAGSVAGSLAFATVSMLISHWYKPLSATLGTEIMSRRNSMRNVAWFGMVLVFALGGFRLAQAIALYTGIPNEDRSLMFHGYEIHHINTGLVLIYVAACCLHCGIVSRRTRGVIFGLLAAGIALVNDQVAYYALKNVSDAAYNGTESFVGAVAVSSVQLLLLISCAMKGHSAND